MILDQNTLWWLLPVTAVIGALLGSLLLRRTGKESNETNQFTSITNALFKRAEQQDKDMADMRVEITELKKQYTAQAAELGNVQRELDDEREATKELKRVNASLVRYVSKLSRLWPQGTTLPEPDEAIS